MTGRMFSQSVRIFISRSKVVIMMFLYVRCLKQSKKFTFLIYLDDELKLFQLFIWLNRHPHIKIRIKNNNNYKLWEAYIYFILLLEYWYVLIKISQFTSSNLRARLAILIPESLSLVVGSCIYIYIGTSLT